MKAEHELSAPPSEEELMLASALAASAARRVASVEARRALGQARAGAVEADLQQWLARLRDLADSHRQWRLAEEMAKSHPAGLPVRPQRMQHGA